MDESADDDIRQRLRPMLSRFTASMTRIQNLEDCMHKDLRTDDTNQHRDQSFPSSGGQTSRSILHKSMDNVKNKMLRLKIMEEELLEMQDRRILLERHVHQQRTTNASFQDPLVVCPEPRVSEGTSVSMEDFLALQARLLETTNRANLLEEELENVMQSRLELETQLEKQKCKLMAHAAKCASLEMKVEVLTNNCEHLTSSLESQEKRNILLEQEVMEVMELQGRNLWKDIDRSRGSESLELTAPLDVSWGESVIGNESNFDQNETIITEGRLGGDLFVVERDHNNEAYTFNER